MTPSELKYQVDNRGSESFFFCFKTMRCWGDTMANFGVRSVLHNGKACWKLYRKKDTFGRDGTRSAKAGSYDLWDKDTFARIYDKRNWS